LLSFLLSLFFSLLFRLATSATLFYCFFTFHDWSVHVSRVAEIGSTILLPLLGRVAHSISLISFFFFSLIFIPSSLIVSADHYQLTLSQPASLAEVRQAGMGTWPGYSVEITQRAGTRRSDTGEPGCDGADARRHRDKLSKTSSSFLPFFSAAKRYSGRRPRHCYTGTAGLRRVATWPTARMEESRKLPGEDGGVDVDGARQVARRCRAPMLRR